MWTALLTASLEKVVSVHRGEGVLGGGTGGRGGAQAGLASASNIQPGTALSRTVASSIVSQLQAAVLVGECTLREGGGGCPPHTFSCTKKP
jgi:hypothetical protein